MLGPPQRLRCEYLENPLGIDAPSPRLSWWVNDTRPAEIQTAYHVLAASARTTLESDLGDLWDTGRVSSPRTLNIEYSGPTLGSGQRVWWKVRTFDSDGLPSAWSEPSWFEMGLLEPGDWRARWISGARMGSASTSVAVPLLTRAFSLSEEVATARLYVTALGLYHARLNGEDVSDRVLAPGWTDFSKRATYQTYDVTALLSRGRNALGLLVADGCYAGHPGIGPRQQYGRLPCVLAQLNVTLASGEKVTVATDERWTWQDSGVLSADPVCGESVDARQQVADWRDGQIPQGVPVVLHEPLDVALAAGVEPALRVIDELTPVAQASDPADGLTPTRRVFDFGERLFGRPRLVLESAANVPVRLRYGTSLDSEGGLGGLDPGEDHYTTRGESQECFEPTFVARGFRYLEITADVPQAALVSVSAREIGSSLTVSGEFSCGHALLNDYADAFARRARATAQHVPLAGLGSQQRLGYTAPARNVLEGGIRQLELAGVYRKWLQDLMDAQLPNGGFPPVVPVPPGVSVLAVDGGAGWSDAFIHCAWSLYRQLGDHAMLERCYAPLRKYLGAIAQWAPDALGQAPAHPLARTDDHTPQDLVAVARYYQTVKLGARVAGVLGRIADVEAYEELAQSIRASFRRRFVTLDGRIVGDTISGYALSLHLGLLDGPERGAAFERLVAQLKATSSFQLDPAHVPYLLGVLTSHGRLDLAYEWLLGPKREPLNDEALGGVCGWLYSTLAGLNLDADPTESHNAYRRLVVRPRPPLGPGFGHGPDGADKSAYEVYEPPIRWVSAALDTVSGRIEASWELTEEAFELRVLVPPNCNALVILPDDTQRSVGSGAHEFSMLLAAPGDGIPILREVSQA